MLVYLVDSSSISLYIVFYDWSKMDILGILFGLCHLPVSISKLCAETRNLVMYIRYLTMFIISKYVLKLKSVINMYLRLLKMSVNCYSNVGCSIVNHFLSM